MKKWIFTAGLFVLFSFMDHTWAERVAEPDTVNLGDVIVTATRTEQEISKIGGSSVSIINAETINAKLQTLVSDVLKGTPGIDIVSSGGPGTNTTVFVRGADSKNTLILIDGMMFNDPSRANRNANIADLTTESIERIEVVRGPMSVLYGSNATAGVINIITKKGAGKPSFHAAIEGGSYNTWKYYGGLLGEIDKFNYSLTGSSIKTDGFSIANDENDDIPHAGNTDENDGWENVSLYGKFGFDITPDFDINANFIYLDSEVDLDDWDWFSGYSGDRFDTDPVTFMPVPSPDGLKKHKSENNHSGGKINIHNFLFNRQFETTLSFQATRRDSTTFDGDGNEWFDYEGSTQEWVWQGGFNIKNRNLINFGLNYYREEMESDSDAIDDKDAYTKSIWIHDQFFLGDNFVLAGGLRYDDHENFGYKTTYRLAPSYSMNRTTLKASYGTGFRSPSLYELYSAFGNEDLDAEESYGWDLGVEQILCEATTMGITYFAMTFDDRIDWDPNRIIPGMPWPGGYNQFKGKTKTKGIEAFINYSPISDLDFLLNYTYTDTEDHNGVHLVRRPYNKVQINAKYTFFDKGTINMDAFWVGERDAITTAMDKNGNPVENLDAYTLFNLAIQYDVTDHLNFHARVDNLFDEFYEEAWSYATPGLSGYVGMKFRY